ncbi:DUF3147 family protein [Bacillus benzoevorans]|uniref:Putative membrane protein (GlpM family) n=1 Tax=Bacillus benzoevorans TaxID=1456 RepID=A0A7X0HQU8_9BACI|nr:DUF3147 family protein [Bacillus benzoevorans]MBB6443945.1 putative membrane protein (GlpM family) [Bacillus benzoevorans]
MGTITLSALLIRFLLGGAAVVVSTIVSRKLGEKAGGIFAAFPAVYLAALLTTGLDFSGSELITHSIVLSKGAIIGMAINIVIAVIAGYLLPKQGWKNGLLQAIGCWFILSVAVVFITAN